jgi:hypothetical protein
MMTNPSSISSPDDRPELRRARPPLSGLCSESERENVRKRYAMIEPLLASRAAIRVLAAQHGNSKIRLIDAIAARHRVCRRTVYYWLSRFCSDGLPGLVRKTRRDKGRPRPVNRHAEWMSYIAASALTADTKKEVLSDAV